MTSAKLYIYIRVGSRDKAHTVLDIFRFAVFFPCMLLNPLCGILLFLFAEFSKVRCVQKRIEAFPICRTQYMNCPLYVNQLKVIHDLFSYEHVVTKTKMIFLTYYASRPHPPNMLIQQLNTPQDKNRTTVYLCRIMSMVSCWDSILVRQYFVWIMS